MARFYLLRLFTRVGWVVKNGQNSVYVVIEWPQNLDLPTTSGNSSIVHAGGRYLLGPAHCTGKHL